MTNSCEKSTYPWVESVRIDDGRPLALAYHNRRMNQTREYMCGRPDPLDLSDIIRVPDQYRRGAVKCRVLYRETVDAVEFHPYTPRRVTSLALAVDDTIDYTYKSTDRTRLDELFRRRGDADDILIVRQGLLTDSWAANIILEDHDGRWSTPRRPLLAGTRRERLIDAGRLREADLTADDLFTCRAVRLCNALVNPDEVSIPPERVRWA